MNLRAYIDQKRGRASSLGRALVITPVLVSQWASGRQVPAERCPAIEKATGGAVTCEELRPDVDWAYLRGTGANYQEPEANQGTVVIPVVTPERRAEGRRDHERRDGERRDSERRGEKGAA